MTIRDDRTEEQKITHRWIIGMTDTFLSGWGKARNGTSYAGWACKDGQEGLVERWVRSRSDAARVTRPMFAWHPKGAGDCHIYVVDDNHPALCK